MQTIEINTEKKYQVTLANNLSSIGETLKPYIEKKAILIYDSNLPKKLIMQIKESFAVSEIEFSELKLEELGENIKTFEHYKTVSEKLMEVGANRKTTLLAVGGGTVGDFIGFVASTFMRGIPFIQVPTTLLSMVDSSVGGKVAINLGNYKNCIGAFYQPKHVFIETSFLECLPNIELISGYAEVLKYGLIQDFEFYQYLLQNETTFSNFLQTKHLNANSTDYFFKIIRKSCEIKADVVSQDEHETKGIRDILNFGHTFAHAFEGLYMGKIPHGIAVGIGIICATKYSKIPTEELLSHYKTIGLSENIQDFCTSHNLSIPTVEGVIGYMQKDKKNVSKNVKLILLKEIGKAITREERSEDITEFLSHNLKK